MRIPKFRWAGLVLLGVLGVSVLSFAQGPRPIGPEDLKLKNIVQRLIDAPSYGTSTADVGARPASLWRKWLRIEVQFDTDAEWVDDVVLKYYVLMGKGRDARLFTGEVTHINVGRGTHYSAMFVHPNTVKRYGGGSIEGVAVLLYYQGRLLDQTSDPTAHGRWWEQYTPVPGFLLSPDKSPWAPIAYERYDAIKNTP